MFCAYDRCRALVHGAYWQDEDTNMKDGTNEGAEEENGKKRKVCEI